MNDITRAVWKHDFTLLFFMFVYKPSIALLPSAKLHNSSIWKCNQMGGINGWPIPLRVSEYSQCLSAVQVLSSGHCRTSWAAGQCHETTTTRQAASPTGAAWAPLLPSPSTKRERPRRRSWRGRSPQRSRIGRCVIQTIYSYVQFSQRTYR